MCWWVMKVVSGRFKRDFKLLGQKYFNRMLPNIFYDFKIGTAMLNHFHIPIGDSTHVEAFLKSIREKIDTLS